jgi:hypothetical protein
LFALGCDIVDRQIHECSCTNVIAELSRGETARVVAECRSGCGLRGRLDTDAGPVGCCLTIGFAIQDTVDGSEGLRRKAGSRSVAALLWPVIQ